MNLRTALAALACAAAFRFEPACALEPPPAGDARVSPELRAAYRDALALHMDRRYDEAVTAFERLIAGGMPPPLDDNCRYWIGESSFGMRRYAEALESFRAVLAFEWSNKKDDAQVMIARCYSKMGEKARAKAEYLKLIETYPASPYAALSRSRAAAL